MPGSQPEKRPHLTKKRRRKRIGWRLRQRAFCLSGLRPEGTIILCPLLRVVETEDVMAVGLGGAEMLIMLALGGGLQSGDLVSYLPAEAYFRSRDVPVNLDNMIYLAEKEPSDGVAQIKQLMCLRLLAEQPEVFKKGKDKAGAMATLRKIASGELANDRTGFAKEYAQRALAV